MSDNFLRKLNFFTVTQSHKSTVKSHFRSRGGQRVLIKSWLIEKLPDFLEVSPHINLHGMWIIIIRLCTFRIL